MTAIGAYPDHLNTLPAFTFYFSRIRVNKIFKPTLGTLDVPTDTMWADLYGNM